MLRTSRHLLLVMPWLSQSVVSQVKLPDAKNTKVGDALRDDIVRRLILRHKPTMKSSRL